MSYLKFGHFISTYGETATANSRPIVIKMPDGRKVELRYQEISSYLHIDKLPSVITILFVGRIYEIQLERVDSNRSTVVIYWDSNLVVEQLKDIWNPKPIFNELSE